MTTYNYLEDYLQKIRSQGRYAFTLSEIKEHFNVSDKALNQNLYRLKAKNKIARIRKGFYSIIAPEYSSYGMIPANLFIDDLMKSLNKRYYVGLISAAALHGAAHQQPMEYFVITQKPALRKIKTKKIKLNFYVKKDWIDKNIMQKKTDAGYINVSSPELTSFDLLYYMSSITLGQTVTILKELISEIKLSTFIKTAKNYPQVAAIQRLGYLLDKEFHNKKLAQALAKILKEKKTFPVYLSNDKSKEGEMDGRWKIIKNITIENDL